MFATKELQFSSKFKLPVKRQLARGRYAWSGGYDAGFKVYDWLRALEKGRRVANHSSRAR